MTWIPFAIKPSASPRVLVKHAVIHRIGWFTCDAVIRYVLTESRPSKPILSLCPCFDFLNREISPSRIFSVEQCNSDPNLICDLHRVSPLIMDKLSSNMDDINIYWAVVKTHQTRLSA
ncbi:hypothetical protein SBA1_1190018 [Candidatus Sulfotelmatobacter kueseliae]|uniref:Uncharacterized protein n=1 Tax=Candidatus Sulfotelmatobacter kueseliae TaxID=2042962 RepID=A0A2U3K1F5_9BACT|nr:hypothetical protein SBA1_1190018 [Candidatus Sulfotelmatobacter kueseliae]